MRLRSLLFVPGDRPDRMQKALSAGADALVLDLEDSVAPSQKEVARTAVAAFLAATDRSVPLFVRINPLQGLLAAADLAAIGPVAPDAIVLPKSEGGLSVSRLDAQLYELELRHGEKTGSIAILPIATETPTAIFGLGTYARASDRLIGLTWGAEDLPAAIGAICAREQDGSYTPPYELVRSLTLFGAAAAGIPAIDTVFPTYRDLEGLAAYAARARRDGFVGMMAIHPSQIPAINAAFTPSAEEVACAQAVVAAFAANPGAGALSVEGRMVDRPHLIQAHKLLSRADPGDTHE